jgi:hypothetical protein
MLRPASRLLLLATMLITGFRPALAGTLCGTVRDASTNAPVGEAGVFLRLPTGAFTGYSGGTAADGSFCIASVPAGTYDLEVQRDDYVVAYLRGVVVTEDAVDVAVTAGAGVALAHPVPNPAISSTTLRWTLPREGTVRMRVYDSAGRFVRGWSGTAPLGAGSITWDLRDAAGRSVPAGIYHVQFEAGGVRLARTVTRIR